MVKTIDKSNEAVFHMLKASVVGGPSIVFHRKHVAGETHIQRVEYNLETQQWKKLPRGKLVKRIVGYDANSLYPWTMQQDMPCGTLTLLPHPFDDVTVLQGIQDGSLFGFVKCDVAVPPELYTKFGEMCPIFVNRTVDPDSAEHVGQFMFERNQEEARRDKVKRKPSKKLLGVLQASQIVLYTPLVEWYLAHGLQVSNCTEFIVAERGRPFVHFVDTLVDRRREHDRAKAAAKRAKAAYKASPTPELQAAAKEAEKHAQAMKVVADSAKLTLNASFGKTVMDKSRHQNVSFYDSLGLACRVNDPLFVDADLFDGSFGAVGDGALFEVTTKKRSILYDTPYQVGSAVYQLAKLRMLQFYYDFVDRFVDRGDFQYVEMDTDSAYMALTAPTFDELVKAELREAYQREKGKWLVLSEEEKAGGFAAPLREDGTPLFDTICDGRTPGLFKVEYEGTHIIALTAKMYFVANDDEATHKASAKGTRKDQNPQLMSFAAYDEALTDSKALLGINTGMRLDKPSQGMQTVAVTKRGLSYYYDKRRVLEDGVTTVAPPV